MGVTFSAFSGEAGGFDRAAFLAGVGLGGAGLGGAGLGGTGVGGTGLGGAGLGGAGLAGGTFSGGCGGLSTVVSNRGLGNAPAGPGDAAGARCIGVFPPTGVTARVAMSLTRSTLVPNVAYDTSDDACEDRP